MLPPAVRRLETSADTKALYDVIGFKTANPVKDGGRNFWLTGTASFTKFENKKPGNSAGF